MSSRFERKGEINFVLIGAKATGKTVYLYNLNKRVQITALDASTIEYIDSLKSSDDKNAIINATSISYTELYFNFKTKKYNLDFQIDDYDGNFVETWHSSENSDYKAKLTEYIKEAEGIFVFLPYEEKNTEIRFALMKKEMDTFIEKIKEEYQEHNELPIPIIIAVTKWDNSPYYLAENENEEAKRYINENPTLKDIKDKLSNYFKTVNIIPLSSEKDHNVTLPLEMALDYTFAVWEEKIEQLSKKEDKSELVIFLSPLLYDLKFYKDGYYVKVYEDAEAEIANSYLNDIKNLKTIKEFTNYYDAHKNILESLSLKHQDLIQTKKDTLCKKKKTKQKGIGLFIVFVFFLVVVFYNNYTTKKEENLLYNDIKTEYSSHNYSGALDNIKKYMSIYKGVNEKHYAEIKNLEEITKDKYRQIIDKKIMELKTTTSLIKKFEIIKDINMQTKKYDVGSVKLQMIMRDFSNTKKDKEAYSQARNLISKMSIDSINKDDVDRVLTTINQLHMYDESNFLKDELNQKLNFIISSFSDFKNEDVIETLISLGSTIMITKEQLAQLNNKLAELKLKSQINFFLRELKKIDVIAGDFDSAKEVVDYVAINWKNEYGRSTAIEVQRILDNKINSFTFETFNKAPKTIEKIDDFDRLKFILVNYMSLTEEIKKLPLNISHTESDNMQQIRQKILELVLKYEDVLERGVVTTSLTFFASKNNSLGFSKSDDNLKIYIDNVLFYRKSQSPYDVSEFKNHYLMTFLKNVRYGVGDYAIKVVESNIFSKDGQMTGIFQITKNDIIKLYNTKEIFIRIIGSDYFLMLKR